MRCSKASWIRSAMGFVQQRNGEEFGVTEWLMSMLVAPVDLIGSAVMQVSEVSWFRGSMILAMLEYCEMSGVTIGLVSRMVLVDVGGELIVDVCMDEVFTGV